MYCEGAALLGPSCLLVQYGAATHRETEEELLYDSLEIYNCCTAVHLKQSCVCVMLFITVVTIIGIYHAIHAHRIYYIPVVVLQ